MIRKALLPYRFYFKLFIAAVILFTFSRIVFAFQNPSTLPANGKTLIAFLAGLRYDITALGWILLPITLLNAYAARFSITQNIRRISAILFVILTGIALFTNYADTGWFSFQKKRSTADVFSVLATGDDLAANLPSYIAGYWYLALLWIISIFVLYKFAFRQIKKNNSPELPSVTTRIITAVLFLGFSVIIIRGGLQLKPLSTQTAAAYAGAESAPLILNTPYTLLKSAGDVALTDPEYFSADEVINILPVHRTMIQSYDSLHRNVVLIILESFSSEYTGKNFTPFLDSLSNKSIFFSRAFANGKRSIEGLPSILASIPALMNEPFITSQYNTVRINSIASLLKTKGYTTSFFHGGKNGTMGFDNFTAAAGFEKYYGESEYDGPTKNNDGNWGIYDHAFYNFMIRKLNETKQPFVSAVFSLSSHHPYKIPDEFQNKYPDGDLPILKSIAYADDALRSFFYQAASQSWYENTVFIITADHTGPTYTEAGSTSTGIFHIPVLIYYPDVTPEIRNDVAQQIDILPTVLHYAGYTGKYSSLGRDLAATKNGYAINYTSGSWQLISDKNVVSWNGEDEPVCNQGRENATACNDEFRLLKAVLQQYRSGLIHNSLATE